MIPVILPPSSRGRVWRLDRVVQFYGFTFALAGAAVAVPSIADDFNDKAEAAALEARQARHEDLSWREQARLRDIKSNRQQIPFYLSLTAGGAALIAAPPVLRALGNRKKGPAPR